MAECPTPIFKLVEPDRLPRILLEVEQTLEEVQALRTLLWGWESFGIGVKDMLSAMLAGGIFIGSGLERSRLGWFEHSAGVGDEVRKGGAEGHERHYGSREQKLQRWEAWQCDLEEQLRVHPRGGIVKAREAVAKKYGVSAKSIARRTFDPRQRET